MAQIVHLYSRMMYFQILLVTTLMLSLTGVVLSDGQHSGSRDRAAARAARKAERAVTEGKTLFSFFFVSRTSFLVT